MQNWTGSVNVTAGQVIATCTQVYHDGDCVVRLTTVNPNSSSDYIVTQYGVDRSAMNDDFTTSIEITDMSPVENTYSIRLSMAVQNDGQSLAEWQIVDGLGDLLNTSLSEV